MRSPFQSLRFARTYDHVVRLGYPIHRLAARALVAFADIQPGHVVLDLGAGTGLASGEALNYRPKRLILVDSSRAMLQVAREHLPPPDTHHPVEVSYLAGDATHLSRLVSPGSIDTVVASYSFGWFRSPRLALREVALVLRPGGVLVLDALPPPGPDARFLSMTPPAQVFERRFRALLEERFGSPPLAQGNRQRLDYGAYARMVQEEGLKVADTLRVEFPLGPQELAGVWRYGWHFRLPSDPWLQRLPRPGVAGVVEEAMSQAKASREYQAWRRTGEPLWETYTALKLRRGRP